MRIPSKRLECIPNLATDFLRRPAQSLTAMPALESASGCQPTCVRENKEKILTSERGSRVWRMTLARHREEPNNYSSSTLVPSPSSTRPKGVCNVLYKARCGPRRKGLGLHLKHRIPKPFLKNAGALHLSALWTCLELLHDAFLQSFPLENPLFRQSLPPPQGATFMIPCILSRPAYQLHQGVRVVADLFAVAEVLKNEAEPPAYAGPFAGSYGPCR
jgi:hypothetical protein